jgi:hypothetical protein
MKSPQLEVTAECVPLAFYDATVSDHSSDFPESGCVVTEAVNKVVALHERSKPTIPLVDISVQE